MLLEVVCVCVMIPLEMAVGREGGTARDEIWRHLKGID